MRGRTDNIDFTHRTHVRLHVLLYTSYPCCGQRSVIRALERIPREMYERTCARCGQQWDIERRTVREQGSGRVDVLEWTPARRISGR